MDEVSSTYSFGGRRGAIIIGINDYRNLTPDKQLKGAVKDAQEFSQKLCRYGRIDDLKYLENENATFDRIRLAINDIFFEEDHPCEQVIFYFAGHGIEDGFGNAYIAPHDFLPEKPYVRGIPMEELRKVFDNYYHSSSLVKKGVCVFLDCCHSGKFIKSGSREIMKKTVDLGYKTKNTLRAGGIVALVSMDVDEKSRERGGYKHHADDNPHFHGIFTSHLLQGLEGAATGTGVITFSGLLDHMKNKMAEEPNQQLQEITLGDAGIADLEIMLAPEDVLNVYIPRLISESSTYNEKNIFSVKEAVEKIKELEKYESYRSDAEECKEIITKYLEAQAVRLRDWIYQNISTKRVYRDQIEKMNEGRLYNILAGLPYDISSYRGFAYMGNFELCLVDALYRAVNESIPSKANDVKAFIFDCQKCIRNI